MRRDIRDHARAMRSSRSNPGIQRGTDLLPRGLTGYKQPDLLYSHKRRVSRVRANDQESLFAKLIRTGTEVDPAAGEGLVAAPGGDMVAQPYDAGNTRAAGAGRPMTAPGYLTRFVASAFVGDAFEDFQPRPATGE